MYHHARGQLLMSTRAAAAVRRSAANLPSLLGRSGAIRHTAGQRSLTQLPSEQHKQGTATTISSLSVGVWLLGAAVASGILLTRPGSSTHADEEAPTALDPQKFKKFKLMQTRDVSHNTRAFRFALDSDNHVLGLNVASCIVMKAQLPGQEKPVIRPYTPTTSKNQKGYFELVIKRYEGGAMSSHVHSLKPGDFVEVKGPVLKIPYSANMKKRIGMIAGGTGITPMLQVIREVLDNPNDHTEISLIFGNVSPDDIILKNELDELASKHRNFKVHYFVDKADDQSHWKGDVGFITKESIAKYLPPPLEGNLIMVCGPPGMMQAISGPKAPDYSQGEVGGALQKLGYSKDNVFKF